MQSCSPPRSILSAQVPCQTCCSYCASPVCLWVGEFWIPVLKPVSCQAGLFSRVLEVLGPVLVQKADIQWTQCSPTVFNSLRARVLIYWFGTVSQNYRMDWVGRVLKDQLDRALQVGSHESWVEGEPLPCCPCCSRYSPGQVWLSGPRAHIAGAGWVKQRSQIFTQIYV